MKIKFLNTQLKRCMRRAAWPEEFYVLNEPTGESSMDL